MKEYTIAETDSEISLITNESLVFTYTEFIEKNELYLFLLNELDKLEVSLEFEYSLVGKLKEYISLLPFDSNEKEECEHRLENMVRLYGIKERLNKMLDDSINEDKVKELSALLEVSNYCPLRNLLEKELEEFKKSFDDLEEAKPLTWVDSINKCETLDEFDDFICELAIDEYINLGQVKRKIVVGKLFIKKENFDNKELFLNELFRIINEVSNVTTVVSDLAKVLVTRQTVSSKELHRLFS